MIKGNTDTKKTKKMEISRNKFIPFYKGKVRELYKLNDDLILLLTTDKVSAFDSVFKETIPQKGIILTKISRLWMEALKRDKMDEKHAFKIHLVENSSQQTNKLLQDKTPPYADWQQRSLIVKNLEVIPYECIVRGYLSGSHWEEYKKNPILYFQKYFREEYKDYQKQKNEHSNANKVEKYLLLKNFAEGNYSKGEKLPKIIFTPSTKAKVGEHDEVISFEEMQDKLGRELSQKLRDLSLAIYKYASTKMEGIDLLLIDTKFEFAKSKKGEIFLVDEVLTPDSSRYAKISYGDCSETKQEKNKKINYSYKSYDKQILRDYVRKIELEKAQKAENKKGIHSTKKNEKNKYKETQRVLPLLTKEIITETKKMYEEVQKKIKEAIG